MCIPVHAHVKNPLAHVSGLRKNQNNPGRTVSVFKMLKVDITQKKKTFTFRIISQYCWISHAMQTNRNLNKQGS